MSNLKYILSEESYEKWQKEKAALKQAFNRDLENILSPASIIKMFREAEQKSYEKVVVKGKEGFLKQKAFKEKMQSESLPIITTVLKVELTNALKRAIEKFKKVME